MFTKLKSCQYLDVVYTCNNAMVQLWLANMRVAVCVCVLVYGMLLVEGVMYNSPSFPPLKVTVWY